MSTCCCAAVTTVAIDNSIHNLVWRVHGFLDAQTNRSVSFIVSVRLWFPFGAFSPSQHSHTHQLSWIQPTCFHRCFTLANVNSVKRTEWARLADPNEIFTTPFSILIITCCENNEQNGKFRVYKTNKILINAMQRSEKCARKWRCCRVSPENCGNWKQIKYE